MPDIFSELVEISRLNGEFAKNYGKLIGGYLYLRSISAARGRAQFWRGVLFAVTSVGSCWLTQNGFSLLSVERAFELVRRSFQIVLFHG
jgi:hypothetical protein